ncbi:G2/mitotic-specific cyclin [Maudiozyma exigua]|uniref:G2/mitotic-specific cyclin n=1 Tax=Maudiozyma exigua TaxID=34358 RepID=A0A9P6W7R6_MAUEX|nr:G2/mitotic-specific cyclin [Kazachstania exigua]
MSSSENLSNTNDSNNMDNLRKIAKAQRLALHNVTNTLTQQENTNVPFKPRNLNIKKEPLERTKLIPSSSVPNSQSSHNSITTANAKLSDPSDTIQEDQINSDDKENQDPFTRTGKSLPSIEEENEIIESHHLHNEERSIIKKESTSSAPSGSKDNQENIDAGKKRPIYTVVEQDEQKKFKVWDEDGTEEYEWEDLDAEDANDPFMVSEYVNDIFDYLHHLEVVTLPRKEDLYQHRNIRQNRDILVNWLVKIHNKFGLLPETLYLAINIMDRFLCKELVQLDKLQLVGTSCLFIASKYEDVYSPSIKHFASETDGACTEEEIKEGILPSLCAAAAMFLSRKMLGKGKWDGNLIHYCGGYNKEQLAPVCHMIMDYLVSPIIHDEFHRKYQSRRFMKASIISVQWALKVRKNDYDIMTLHE